MASLFCSVTGPMEELVVGICGYVLCRDICGYVLCRTSAESVAVAGLWLLIAGSALISFPAARGSPGTVATPSPHGASLLGLFSGTANVM